MKITPPADKTLGMGTLLVCLPHHFSGGEVVVLQQQRRKVLNWSDSSKQKIQWVAFLNRAQVELYPVREGHRMVLLYRLYQPNESKRSENAIVQHSLFRQVLKEAVGNPHFMRGGGVLGFACSNKYVLTDLNEHDAIPSLLRGADYDIYMSANSLNLAVAVMPIVFNKMGYQNVYVLKNFVQEVEFEEDFYFQDLINSDKEILSVTLNTELHCGKITWCFSRYNSEIVSSVIYSCRVPDEIKHYYQAPAILVVVPKWSNRNQCYAGSESVWQNVVQVDKEMIGERWQSSSSFQ